MFRLLCEALTYSLMARAQQARPDAATDVPVPALRQALPGDRADLRPVPAPSARGLLLES